MSKLPVDDILAESLSSAFNSCRNLRGEPNKELDQYYITKETSLQRALLFNKEDYEKKRVLMIGDMDLTSVLIGKLANIKDLAIADIDKRLPEIVFNMKFKQKIKTARFINHDIRLRMLAILKNQFEYIFVEPVMTLEGIEVGLSRAVQSARKDVPSYIVFSYDLEKEKEKGINSLITKMDLEILEDFKDFNKYENETPLKKKTSDVLILRVKKNSKETIAHHYLGPYYFRECIIKPSPYLCKCGKILSIGSNGNYKSIAELESLGCPECGYNEKFLYNSSIKIE